jgi:hypothetical protein
LAPTRYVPWGPFAVAIVIPDAAGAEEEVADVEDGAD